MFSANENIQLRQQKRVVVGFVEATIPDDVLDLGVNVMVMQVSCKAPGCVPVETAIIVVFPSSAKELLEGLPESAGGSYKTKVLKPLSEVTRDDVLEALPEQFKGGKRSLQKLCIQARDVMLGQITQLFDERDVNGRKLLADYLQASLQAYVDNGCEPPEWGQEFDNVKQANSEASSVVASTGNIILRRPVDDENERPALQSVNNLEPLATLPSAAATSGNPRRPQQQQAQLTSATSILQRLGEREHAPGIRRPGCPCCDPDSPENFVNQMMQL
jgi:hypothetical protein